MAYETQKEKVKNFIIEKIMPVLQNKDLDYYELINYIQEKTGQRQKLVEEVLLELKTSKVIKEHRILTIPDEKIQDWLDKVVSEDKKAQEVVDNLGGEK